MMKFSEFCDMAENTEQEQQLLQFFKQDGMEDAEKVFVKMAHIPVIGKIFTALVALGNYKSIAAFRQSRHYQNLRNWNVDIDFDKRSLMINASAEQKRKAMKILAAVSAGIALLVICRRLCCRRK